MDQEIWKDAVGYEEVYQVSNKGHIKRIANGPGTHPGKVLKLVKCNTGYLIVTLCKNGDCQNTSVHRLVATAFLGSAPSPEHQVNHKNGIKNDNRIENLEWVTVTENNRHAYRVLDKQLTCSKGEDRYNAQLSCHSVIEIRQLYATGKYTQAEIAEKFHVMSGVIWSVVHGETWRHIGGPIAPNNGLTRGEDCPNAKLTQKDVVKIRQLYATGNHTLTALAETFAISTISVFDVIHRKTWKHVP